MIAAMTCASKTCTAAAEPGRRLCEACQKRENANQRRLIHRRIAAGDCRRCGRRRARPGLQTCLRCGVAEAATAATGRRRRQADPGLSWARRTQLRERFRRSVIGSS